MQPIIQPTPKQKLIEDLYRILYMVPFHSAPDNWDLVTGMAKVLLNHHNVHFKDVQDMPDSEYWRIDTEEHFYLSACPGSVPSLTQFEYLCNECMEWDMWEATHSLEGALPDLHKAVKGLLGLTCVVEPEPSYGAIMMAKMDDSVIIVEPVKDAA